MTCRIGCDPHIRLNQLQKITNTIHKLHQNESEELCSIEKKYDCGAFVDFLAYLYKFSKIVELPSNFEGASATQKYSIDEPLAQEVFRLLTIFQMYLANKRSLFNARDIQVFTAVCSLIIVEHSQSTEAWATCALTNTAQILLAKILQMHDIETMEQLLSLMIDHKQCVFKTACDVLRPFLSKDRWQSNPASVVTFLSMLKEIKSPTLGECLTDVFPPMLLLIDDFEPANKLLGIQCAHHIVDNTSRSELNFYGRADVLYGALFNLLHNNDANVLCALLPCLFKLSQVIDFNTPPASRQPVYTTRLEEVFTVVLTNMDFEDKLHVRREYAVILEKFIDVLRIQVVKHMQRILSVMERYLEVNDRPGESARLAILSALRKLIEVAWIRIPRYHCKMMHILLKLLIEVTHPSWSNTDDVNNNLVSSVKDAIMCLSQLDKEKTSSVLKAVLTIDLFNDDTKAVIENLMLSIHT